MDVYQIALTKRLLIFYLAGLRKQRGEIALHAAVTRYMSIQGPAGAERRSTVGGVVTTEGLASTGLGDDGGSPHPAPGGPPQL